MQEFCISMTDQVTLFIYLFIYFKDNPEWSQCQQTDDIIDSAASAASLYP